MSSTTDRVRLTKYVLLQITIGPSLICDLFVFIYFFLHWKKEILTTPRNHVTLCLLIISFVQKTTDIIFHLYYLRWGTVLLPTYSFCVIWNWVNYSLYCVSLDLVTWCCVERHLFVFHSRMMKKKLCLILFHYMPLIICLSYTPLFYFYFIFSPKQCINTWDYTMLYCGRPCYLSYDQSLGIFDWLFHCGIPILIIFLTNLLLCYRIIWQKIKRQRPVTWNREKRMIIQLGFISALFLILASPAVVVGCIQLLWLPTFLSDMQNDYFYYIGCFINQFLPFIIIGSLPKLTQESRQWIEHVRIRLRGRLRIQPVITITAADANDGAPGITLQDVT